MKEVLYVYLCRKQSGHYSRRAFIGQTLVCVDKGITNKLVWLMKVLELMKISTEVLKLMTKNDIHRDDYLYVKAYEEFLMMRRNRMKYHAAIKILSEDYHIGERTLQRVFKRLSSEC